jgi:murein hydrolase activator
VTRTGGQSRKHEPPWARWPLALVLCALPFAPLRAAEPQQQLKRVEGQLDSTTARKKALERQADALRDELDRLRDQLIDLTAESQAQEIDLDRIEGEIRRLEETESAQAARLETERAQIAALIGAFARMARLPPSAVIARPQGPLDTLRSALALRDTLPPLKDRAAVLSHAIAALAETRTALERDRAAVAAARDAVEKRRADIERLVARREELLRVSADERESVQKRMAKLTDQAGDLRQLMEKIEQDRRTAAATAAQREMQRLEASRREAEERAAREAEKREAEKRDAAQREAARKEADKRDAEKRTAALTPPEPPPATAPAIGSGLRAPVAGKLSVRFGEADRFGATARGITIASRPGAPVVAPATGTVVFSGPFRGYGLILIVEHGNGYHSLIAGLGRIDATVGRVVAAGEPIGQMPTPAEGAPDLYFELRRHGQPTNPQRGFGASEAKGHG